MKRMPKRELGHHQRKVLVDMLNMPNQIWNVADQSRFKGWEKRHAVVRSLVKHGLVDVMNTGSMLMLGGAKVLSDHCLTVKGAEVARSLEAEGF